MNLVSKRFTNAVDFSTATLAINSDRACGVYRFIPTDTVKETVVTITSAAGRHATVINGAKNTDTGVKVTVKGAAGQKLYDSNFEESADPDDAKGAVLDGGKYGDYVQVQAIATDDLSVVDENGDWMREK